MILIQLNQTQKYTELDLVENSKKYKELLK